jgi:uncharacterized repeat protein (TIGR03803 family)
MKPFKTLLQVAHSLLFAVCILVLSVAPQALGDTVLHPFTGGTTDGARSIPDLVNDEYGNLYGVTSLDGLYGHGTVFVMCAPGVIGSDLYPCAASLTSWTEYVLYNFKGVSSLDGALPLGALVFGGNYFGRAFTLYGTTNEGGKSSCSSTGCGTVFELCAPSNFGGCGGVNLWTENVLHRFAGGSDGAYPVGGVINDKEDNLYGTTENGGGGGTCTNYCGTVFKLKGYTGWTFAETIFHRFTGATSDGANPFAGLCCKDPFPIKYLYGTTLTGGTSNLGTAFRVKIPGVHTEVVLRSFVGGTADGATPYGNLVPDSAGNLYGTASADGAHNNGIAFKLTYPTYFETVLYSFAGAPADGGMPLSGLTFDTAGNLWGTTYHGGTTSGCTAGACGTLYYLNYPTYAADTVVWNFIGGVTDGSNPVGGVILDPPVSTTEEYGVTRYGGSSSDAVVYSQP